MTRLRMGRAGTEWTLSHFLQFYLNYVLTLSSHEWIQGKESTTGTSASFMALPQESYLIPLSVNGQPSILLTACVQLLPLIWLGRLKKALNINSNIHITKSISAGQGFWLRKGLNLLNKSDSLLYLLKTSLTPTAWLRNVEIKMSF